MCLLPSYITPSIPHPIPAPIFTFSDWLRDPALSGPHCADLAAGHLALGQECAKEVIRRDGFHCSSYCLMYAVKHMTEAGPQAFTILDQGAVIYRREGVRVREGDRPVK